LKGCFPLVAKKAERLGAHSHHPQGRNAVEHSEQCAELCEWAVAKNRSAEGGTKPRVNLGWKEVKPSRY
jgi:hypothetical protein